ncbi:MAG: 3'-phosphoesterase [Nitrososphaerota archaeon]|nr:3'-phosphoesterase [Nitrososphaerota archaeon]
MDRGLLFFVVQKHRATAMHYDFRLEIGGVMPSWSVPKGPTLDPGVRRLAMPTGPHDLEYRNFEGVIGEGYGAGTVMIWDEGTFTPEIEAEKGVRSLVGSRDEAEEVAQAGLRVGSLKFTLYGKKLNGSFALIRTKGLGGSKEAWLLIKHKDRYCEEGYDAKQHDFSAASGRTLSQIAHETQPPLNPWDTASN